MPTSNRQSVVGPLTSPILNPATLYLNLGSTVLDFWPKNFHRLPSIGDLIPIESKNLEILQNYKSHARITKIEPEVDHRTKIDLEAEVRSKSATRTVVFLNENHVPRYWRRSVEAHLAKLIELPIFGWARSNLPHPVIRVYATPAFTPTQLRKLRSEVRNVIDSTEAAIRQPTRDRQRM